MLDLKVLRRINLRCTKDKNPPTDRSQVPASGATFGVFRQGATLLSGITYPASSTFRVTVGDTGTIQPGDNVQWSQDLSRLLFVEGIDVVNRQWIDLQAQDGLGGTLSIGDGLIPLTSPTLYKDEQGLVPLGSNVITLDTNGRGTFFLKELDFYGVLTGAGTNQFFPDQPGGLVNSGPWVNVLDYPTFQAAHDDLPASGGTIFVPAGKYSASSRTAFTGLAISKGIAIIGEGDGPWVAMSQINPSSNDTTAIAISVNGVLIQNLFIEWLSPGIGQARGIRWYKPGPNSKLANLELNNVVIHQSPNLGFEFVCDGYIDDGTPGHSNDGCYISKLVMVECAAYGAVSGGSLLLGGNGSNNNFFERCEFDGGGFGWFHDVNGCRLVRGDVNVAAVGTDDFATVQHGDEVSGQGIVVGTTVLSATSGAIVLSQAAVSNLPSNTLTFYRALGTPDPSRVWLQRGHVHLLRTVVSRFHHCSFQGPGTSPALSSDLISNNLVLRDTYREKDSTLGTYVHSFVINNMTNLLIDGLFHQFHTDASLLLMTGPAGLSMGRLANAQLMGEFGLAVVLLSNTTDELIIDNCRELSNTGSKRKLEVVTGTGSRDVPGLSTVTLVVGRYASASPMIGSLSSQKLLAGSDLTAGLYRVSFYMMTTTASPEPTDTVSATVTWNDGSLHSHDVAVLDLSTANAVTEGSMVLKAAASQDVTFLTTVHQLVLGGAYKIEARLEALDASRYATP